MKSELQENQKTRPVLIHVEECETEGWREPERSGVQWWTLLSADRTPSESITCGVAEIGPALDEGLVMHRHAQPEVYYVLTGEGIVTIEGDAYPVRAGSTLFIPGNWAHGTRNTGSTPLRLFYLFAVDSFEEVVYEFAGMDGRAKNATSVTMGYDRGARRKQKGRHKGQPPSDMLN